MVDSIPIDGVVLGRRRHVLDAHPAVEIRGREAMWGRG